jgi:thymidylate kinase
MKSYREQQRERLSDSIFEYISDEKITADEFISEFYDEVKEAFDYFDKYAQKCKQVIDKLPKKVVLADGYSHSEHYYDYGRNKTYDEVIAEGYTMSDDGFWMPPEEKKISNAQEQDWEKFWEENGFLENN